MSASTQATPPDKMTPKWLTKPYYPLPEPQVYVQSHVANCPSTYMTTTLTVECALQAQLASVMSNIEAWLNPDYNTFQTSRTLLSLIDDFTTQAIHRLFTYPDTGAGKDPEQLGFHYGRLQMSIMRQIDSGDGKTSLWDAWTAMTEPVK